MKPGLAALVALALSVGSVAAHAAGRDPIVGFWNFSGGVVEVSGSGTSFTGTVRKQTRFSRCPHEAGEVMWRITGSNGTYTGAHLAFSDVNDCSKREEHATSFAVSGSTLAIRIAHRAGLQPGDCGADTDCFTLTRATPPAPAFRWSVGLRAGTLASGPIFGRDYVRTDGRGNGSFTTRQPDTSGFAAVTGARGGLVLVHRFGVAPKSRTIVLKAVSGGSYTSSGTFKAVDLVAVVTASDDPKCLPGSRAKVTLRDAGSEQGEVDAVLVDVCGVRLAYFNEAKEPVTVVISQA